MRTGEQLFLSRLLQCNIIMECGKVVIKYIRIKPLKVQVKRLRLDPEALQMWKTEIEKDAEVIEIR